MPGFKAATPQASASTHKVQPTPSRQNKEKKVHKLIKLKSVETTMVMNKQNVLNKIIIPISIYFEIITVYY